MFTEDELRRLRNDQLDRLIEVDGDLTQLSDQELDEIIESGEEYSDLGAGFASLGSAFQTGLAGILGSEDLAEQARRTQEEIALRRTPDVPSIIESFEEEGILGGLADVPEYIKEQLLFSLPQFAGQLGAGVIGTRLGGPRVGAAAAVGSFTPAFAGYNIQRQMEEQGIGIEDAQVAKAFAVGTGQAALDALVGRTLGVFGRTKGAEEIAKAAERGIASRIARKGLEGAGVEAATELGQQTLEILQANPEKFFEFGPEVQRELAESAIAGGLIGGTISAPAGIVGGPRKKKDEDKIKDLEEHLKEESQETLRMEEEAARFEGETLRLEQLPPELPAPETAPALPSPDQPSIQVPPTARQRGTVEGRLAGMQETVREEGVGRAPIFEEPQAPEVLEGEVLPPEPKVADDSQRLLTDRSDIVQEPLAERRRPKDGEGPPLPALPRGTGAIQVPPTARQRGAREDQLAGMEEVVSGVTQPTTTGREEQIIRDRKNEAVDPFNDDRARQLFNKVNREEEAGNTVKAKNARQKLQERLREIGYSAEEVSKLLSGTPAQREQRRLFSQKMARQEAEQTRETAKRAYDSQTTSKFNQRAEKIRKDLGSELRKLGLSDVALRMDKVIRPEPETLAEGVTEQDKFGNVLIALSSQIYSPGMSDAQLKAKLREVMNHEMIHAMKMLGLFSDAEFQSLVTAATSQKFVDRQGKERLFSYLDRAKALNPKAPPGVDLLELQQEEAVAELFRDWAADRKKIGGKPQSLFKKIVNFIKTLGGILDKQGVNDPTEIFEAIQSGEIGRRDRKPEDAEGQRFSRRVGPPRVMPNGEVVGSPPNARTEEDREKIIDDSVEMMESDFALYQKSKDWYERSGRAIRDVTRGDPELMDKTARLMALYSQGNSVGGNTTATVKSLYQLATGQDTAYAGRFPETTAARVPALLSAPEFDQSVPGVSDKLENFYRNLIDAARGTDTYANASTMDKWMMRLFGYKVADDEEVGGSANLSATQYRYARDLVDRIADKWEAKTGEKLLPRQVQAVLWTYVKNKANYDKIKDPEKKAKFVPEAIDFSDYLTRATAHITWESRPSESLPLLSWIHEAPRNVQEMFNERVREIFTNPDGSDKLMELLGGNELYNSGTSTGAYEGKVTPNIVSRIVLRKDTDGYVDDIATQYASLLGYITRQDAVPWYRPDIKGGKLDSVGHSLEFEQELTPELENDLIRHLDTLIPGIGYTKVGDSLQFINFRDENGKPFLMSDKKFLEELTSGLKSFDADIDSDLETFRAQSEYIANDWTEDPNGEGYIQRYGESRFKDIQPTVDGWANEYIEAVNEFEARRDELLEGATENIRFSRRFSATASPSDFRAFAESVIDTTEPRNGFEEFMRKFVGAAPGERMIDAFVRNNISRFEPAYKLDADVYGTSYDNADSVGRGMELSQQVAGRVEAILKIGPIAVDKDGNVSQVNDPDVKPIEEIFKPLLANKTPQEAKQAEADFYAYGVARREKAIREAGRAKQRALDKQLASAIQANNKNLEAEIKRQKKDVLMRGFLNLSDTDIDNAIRTAPPLYEQIFNDYQKFNNYMVKFGLDSGLFDEQMAQEFMNMAYVPFYRQLDTAEGETDFSTSMPRRAARSLMEPGAFDKELVGSNFKIKGDLIQNIMSNNASIISSGLRNIAMQKTGKALEKSQDSTWGERVNPKETGSNIMRFRENGVERAYKIYDEPLWIAVSGLAPQQKDMYIQLAEKFSGILRTGVTAFPGFMLANLWRGKIDAYIKADVPLDTGGDTIRRITDSIRGGGNTDAVKMMTGFGGYGFGATPSQFGESAARKIRSNGKLFGQDIGIQDSFKNLLNAIETVGEATEMDVRVGLYEKLLADNVSPREAAFQAMNLINYGRRGAGGGILGSLVVNRLLPAIPFLNARIQGLYRLVEDPRTTPEKKREYLTGIMARGAVISLASIALGVWAMSDDRWEEERLENKINYDIIYIGPFTIKLPRAFELGSLFGMLPVMIIDGVWRMDGSDVAKGAAMTFLNTLSFNPTPQSTLPLLEVITGYDFFRMQPLEGIGLQNKLTEERYYSSTPELYKFLSRNGGSLIGLSPIEIQNLMEGYLAGFATMPVAILESTLSASGAIPSKPNGVFGNPYASDVGRSLGLTRFFQVEGEQTSQFVNEFYTIRREMDQLNKAINDAAERNDTARVKSLLERQDVPLALRKQFNRVATQLSEINNAMNQITMSSLSSSEKTERLRQLRIRKNELTRAYVEAAERAKLI